MKRLCSGRGREGRGLRWHLKGTIRRRDKRKGEGQRENASDRESCPGTSPARR